MKNILVILMMLSIISSCVREDEDQTTCYNFINGTNRTVEMIFYSYNSGQFVSEIGRYEENSQGPIVQKCDRDVALLGPATVLKADSVVINFDANKRQIYIKRFDAADDPFFFSSFYDFNENQRTFSYTFTEQDYNNAEPY